MNFYIKLGIWVLAVAVVFGVLWRTGQLLRLTHYVQETKEEVKKSIEKALADDDSVLWLTDSRGRVVGVPSERVAYVEIESDGETRRVGFGRG